MGISDFSTASLNRWFATRMHYIVSEDYSWKSNYQIQRVFSASPTVVADSSQQTSATTNASNMGGEIYLYQVPLGMVLNISVDGNMFTIDTPRVGFVRIGPGLFSRRIRSGSVTSLANSLLRLTTLFHEARHTDFNGSNAAAPHIVCTNIPELNGDYACEGYRNGPYEVGVAVLRHFLGSYSSKLTSEERADLNMILASYAKRLSPDATFQDDRPEKIR